MMFINLLLLTTITSSPLPLPLMVPCAELSISSRAYIHQVRAQEHYQPCHQNINYILTKVLKTSTRSLIWNQSGASWLMIMANKFASCFSHSFLRHKLKQIQELGNWESKILSLCMGENL
jgi:hypothetical protein